MSFAEFQIRLFAYNRVQQREWEKIRFMSYHAMTGSHQDPKKLPKSLNQFMNLDLDKRSKSLITEAQKQRFLEVSREYYEQINRA
jgi:hypothetical protein